jgi:Forty-two-three protein
MLDKIEMSLDDIIKSNKKSNIKSRRPGQGGFKKSPTKKFGGNSGILKGRGRGGITRSKYTRVS